MSVTVKCEKFKRQAAQVEAGKCHTGSVNSCAGCAGFSQTFINGEIDHMMTQRHNGESIFRVGEHE